MLIGLSIASVKMSLAINWDLHLENMPLRPTQQHVPTMLI